jgi:hypothetical protein
LPVRSQVGQTGKHPAQPRSGKDVGEAPCITGSFANPTEPQKTIKFNGVILQGQTNAQGYFLGTNQSGTFTLEPQ